MGYTFTIGKAVLVAEGDGDESTIFAEVQKCEGGKEVHFDDMDCDSGPCRWPSYTQWASVLEVLPRLRGVFKAMQGYCKEQDPLFIPVKFYADCLDAIEQEALACADKDAGKRGLWFARWSRHALKLYGPLAAFNRPGEW